MEGFASDLTSRIRASRTRPRRTASDPGPHRPARSFVFDSSGQAGENSAIGTPRQQEQEYLRNVPVLRAEPGDNPAGHEIMRPGEPATFTPSPLVRRATIGGEVVLPNPLTSSGFRRPLTFKSVVSALRISPGETRLQKVKDLWRRARDRLKKDSST
ncbi:hypothetical protein L873DRAFT_503238 [Choiromyces venosus 120613-1]|uniref:Uncharacterized protein n=1 Tax=Choiromyces venosus 120613-1 TaxID=1336337 RepID=A0A3N4IZA2_9PEZI|nr:hypothetical protein L873DRAFT_503238 [Choiromyces venosus 120613-1]